ncbi:MAG: ATP-binding protein [Myxococcaceae bacterium]|nr:ATP-binding protein [Myxococcaceae bacterium]
MTAASSFSAQPHRSQLPLVAIGILLLSAGVFSVASAAFVWRGRRAVESNVHLLAELQRMNETLVAGGQASPAVLAELASHTAPEVVAATARLQQRLATSTAPAPDRDALAAIGQVIASLRKTNSEQSAQLGDHIDHLYLTVALLVVLATFTMVLVRRVDRDARLLARLADERIAAAHAEHTQRLALVNTLAATTAHEVNNPLTAMLLSLDYVRQQVAPLAPALSTSVSAAIDGGQRIRVIVASLRNLAAQGEGGEVELKQVVEATLRLLEHRLEPRATVVVKLAEAGRVKASYVELGQVLSNLVVNAVEAFGDRPKEKNEIVLASRADGADWLELRVSDNGPGFTPADLPRLTTPFFTTKATGSGLGLFVCKRLVEAFGGTLELVPAPAGATVVVRLRRAVA